MSRGGLDAETIRRRVQDGGKRKTTSSLHRNRNSLYCYLMQEALEDQGIKPEEAGEVEQTYLEDEGVVVINLNSEGGRDDAPR